MLCESCPAVCDVASALKPLIFRGQTTTSFKKIAPARITLPCDAAS